jgi:hypothetical protein
VLRRPEAAVCATLAMELQRSKAPDAGIARLREQLVGGVPRATAAWIKAAPPQSALGKLASRCAAGRRLRRNRLRNPVQETKRIGLTHRVAMKKSLGKGSSTVPSGRAG